MALSADVASGASVVWQPTSTKSIRISAVVYFIDVTGIMIMGSQIG